jgi:hypothetical protein
MGTNQGIEAKLLLGSLDDVKVVEVLLRCSVPGLGYRKT